jgi:hypothetical protein
MTKLGFWLTLAIPAVLFFLMLVVLVAAAAKSVELAPHSVEAVQQKCASHHGRFFANGVTYGCVLPKGIVTCSAINRQCRGIPRAQARPHIIAPPPMPEYQWRDDQW